ncbi:nucleotidyltransferase domain-containing protein [Pseudonocardia kunmingensis]|uniref:Aminoglycoside-2''-adenylyltransferase n=1 Tax=Pseudonocardia kunmingensis TaxID=630975 RepID=A0A543DIB3_9PSEU|nr:amino acid transporter [Pseudonocardia kunmingensis]TQM09084.1 hypothetical protein FB558_4827 [Pseudonocardia kunmingensis]
MAAADLGPWEPATVREVATYFARFPGPWWIAGGFAIELATGRTIRPHDDIDVGLLRSDHLGAHGALPGWELWAADPPGQLRPWRQGEPLPAHVHDVWCRPGAASPWRVQLMIDESDGPDWVSRRDPRLRRPVRELVRRSADGIPFLAPEVQLHHKARACRPKDVVDLHAALPVLGPAERAWLREAIAGTTPDHPWLVLLQ